MLFQTGIVPTAAKDDYPTDAGSAWGGEVVKGGYQRRQEVSMFRITPMK